MICRHRTNLRYHTTVLHNLPVRHRNDKFVISYLVATGLAAGFRVTKDLKDAFIAFVESNSTDPVDEFFSKGYASASLLLFAFLCLADLFSHLLPLPNDHFKSHHEHYKYHLLSVKTLLHPCEHENDDHLPHSQSKVNKVFTEQNLCFIDTRHFSFVVTPSQEKVSSCSPYVY
ncbi:unnamed protein product [Thlaspi arvense]|uniref:Uncharacterized protein n=1 Tax=Thlaspi arvense TaxID=13288 RepID=A0AAU9S9E2_THLAR|nr:unnamed protein product [Thlaspi arvense]